MRKIRILFEAYNYYHLPQYLPFYNLIKDDPRFDIYFATSTGDSVQERDSTLRHFAANEFRVIYAGTEELRCNAIDRFDPDFIIIGWSRKGYLEHVLYRPGRPVFIMMYHGIGIKSAYYRDNSRRVQYRVVESPYRMEQLKRHGCHATLLPAGFIKLDPLFHPDQTASDAVRLELRLDPRRKTVLYAPTYYPSSIGIVKDEIGGATRGCNLIVKLHNYTWFRPEHAADLASMKDLARNFDHVRLLPPDTVNVLPYMQVSDLMITDASSVMFEYLPLDRPLIVFTRYKLIWRHWLFRYFFRKTRIDQETAGFKDFFDPIEDPKKLRGCIDRNLADPMRLSSARRKCLKDVLYYADGKSAHRLLEQFEKLL
jgi:CDP-glycerol glycerophosphotransferase (TagB/SpsB family)